MKIINFILFSFIATGIFAQGSPADAIFDKYAEKDGFSTVFISKHMFSLFANAETENSDDDLLKIISGLESIKILSVEDSVLNTQINLYKEIMKDVKLEDYKQLMVIKEKDQDTRMMIRESNGKILEFLMIGGGFDNFVISITGNINLKSLSKISKSMDIKGLENIEKLE